MGCQRHNSGPMNLAPRGATPSTSVTDYCPNAGLFLLPDAPAPPLLWHRLRCTLRVAMISINSPCSNNDGALRGFRNRAGGYSRTPARPRHSTCRERQGSSRAAESFWEFRRGNRIGASFRVWSPRYRLRLWLPREGTSIPPEEK